MKRKSLQLKELRTAILRKQQATTDKAKAENREFTPEEQTELDAQDDEIADLDKQIETAEKNEAREARFAAMNGTPVGTGFHGAGEGSAEEREKDGVFKRANIVTVLRGLSSKSGYKLEGAEKEMHEIGLEENRNAGVSTPEDTAFAFPINAVTRATQQTVTEDGGEYGGNLVQDQPLRMIEGLRPKLFLEELGATFFMGLTGGDLPLVSSDAFSMGYYGEVDEISVQKHKFGGKVLTPNRTAGAVDISNRLLMQSSIDVESWIFNELRGALGRVIQAAAINGTGTGNQPLGLLNMTDVPVSADTAAVVAAWEKLIELQGLIESENATENSLGYLIHPKVKAALKVIKKDAGSGQFLFEKGMIDDIKTVSTTLIPLLTDVYPIIYGDWKQLFMGQWGALNIQANPFSADLSNATRFVFNTYTDSNVVNRKAFAMNKFIKGSAS